MPGCLVPVVPSSIHGAADGVKWAVWGAFPMPRRDVIMETLTPNLSPADGRGEPRSQTGKDLR